MPRQAEAQTRPVTVVIPLTVAEGTNRAAAIVAMQRVAAFVRRQPGLIDEQLLESSLPSGQPALMHLMRWREQANWEAMSGSDAFQKVLSESGPLFSVDLAGIYKPVR